MDGLDWIWQVQAQRPRQQRPPLKLASIPTARPHKEAVQTAGTDSVGTF